MGQVIETEANQVIETDDAGRLIIPAEILGSVKPHTRYTVEAMGTKLVVGPEATSEQRKLSLDEWERQWKELQELMTKVWKTDKSAAEIISEMRR